MRLALDLSPWVHRKAGLGTYAGRLAEALARAGSEHSFTLFHYGQIQEPPPTALDHWPRISVPWGARRWRLTVALRCLLEREMDSLFPGADLFHATEHLLPPLRRIHTVFTFHDAIYALFPQYHLPLNRLFLGQMMPRFLARASSIIAVSESSKRDAVRLYGTDPARVQVIYEGVDPRFRPLVPSERETELARVRAAYHLPPTYLFYFGTIEPRKNLDVLFEAFHALLARGEAAPDLVIAGRPGWLYEPTLKRVRELGLEGRVHFTGWVAERDAVALLNGAVAFVFPSLYEGFGLPPLEALACGTPVLCSNASSLPEVVGDAGLLFDPRDAGALTRALSRLITDESLRADLRARGPARAAQFTWERAAAQTLALYERVARAPETI